MTIQKKLRLVTFGNSITLAKRQAPTRRWPSIVTRCLNEFSEEHQVDLINAGVGGNTSREGLARIATDVIAHQPDIVTIEFGGNDATPDQQRHVSFDEFTDNLQTIKQQIMDNTSAAIVILPFPPVIEEQHSFGNDLFFDELGGQDAYIDVYRNISRKFAQENNLVLADIDQALRENIKRKNHQTYILDDGVHLTEEGNAVVAKTVFNALKQLITLT